MVRYRARRGAEIQMENKETGRRERWGAGVKQLRREREQHWRGARRVAQGAPPSQCGKMKPRPRDRPRPSHCSASFILHFKICLPPRVCISEKNQSAAAPAQTTWSSSPRASLSGTRQSACTVRRARLFCFSRSSLGRLNSFTACAARSLEACCGCCCSPVWETSTSRSSQHARLTWRR